MSRTVVWDLGRVVVHWDPHRAVADHLTEAQWAAFAEEVGFDALNRRLDGGLPAADAVAEVARTHPAHAATLERYVAGFAGSLARGPVPGTTELITELHAAGVRQLGLTNWSAETFHHAAVAAPVIGLLEDVLVSGRVGLTKPDPRIFALLLRTYALDPATTVFIDDSPANVAAAADAGIDAIVFTGAADLRAALLDRGLPVRPA